MSFVDEYDDFCPPALLCGDVLTILELVLFLLDCLL